MDFDEFNFKQKTQKYLQKELNKGWIKNGTRIASVPFSIGVSIEHLDKAIFQFQ
jgi:hypothetical protein